MPTTGPRVYEDARAAVVRRCHRVRLLDGLLHRPKSLSPALDINTESEYTCRDMNRRAYDMTTRAAASAATRSAIVQAALDVFEAERSFQVSLGAVAERAGVTVRTVQRHFGSRDELIDAAWSEAYRQVLRERTPPPADPVAALEVLVAHYERRGEVVLGVLAEEDDDPRARRMNDAGRLGHRAWVDEVFADRLPAPGPERTSLIDVLVVATDVYAWKLLRLDRGLPADEVRARMTFMTDAILRPVDG